MSLSSFYLYKLKQKTMQAYHIADITINAPREAVWNALTNPDQTGKYMFGCRVVTDWKPGSRVDWVGMQDGKQVTFVTGEVVTYKPFGELAYTVIDPAASYPLTPENHLIVKCTLSDEGDSTNVHVTQGDYTKVAEGEKRYGHGNGWAGVLSAIKNLLEVS